MSINTGGQAFPNPVSHSPLGQEIPSYPGMTLRAYIATKVMAEYTNTDGVTWVQAAKASVTAADALIAALEAS